MNTPLQQAAHDIGAKGSEPTENEQLAFEAWWAIHHEDATNYRDAFDAGCQAARKALADEQAQAVEQEPVAWTLTETLNKRVTTTSGHLWFSDPVNYCWTPLYLRPAPPPAVTGERAELVAGLIRKADAWDFWNPEAKRPNVCRKAADMLEADAQEIKRLEQCRIDEAETTNKAAQASRDLLTKALNQAQQVTVHPGYALAMAVLQSSLYQFLDDVERAECDALIAAAQGSKP